MKENLLNKSSLRASLKKRRREIPSERRVSASEKLFALLPALGQFNSILSFASFSEEIDSTQLNHALAQEGKLLLPKVEENKLVIYRVTDLDTELEKGPFGFFEPLPSKCKAVLNQTLDLILVPGLGFDKNLHRIGYGGGYYDRFLSQIPHCHTIGIGFTEQFVEKLPTEPTDFPLKAISLF